MIDWDEFKPFFFFIYFSAGIWVFGPLRLGVMKTQTLGNNERKKFFLSLKMFYGHAMLIGGKPERIEIFIVSGLSLSRPVDTKADLKLNNIIATPSSNLILTPLDECQSWWALTIRDMRPWRYNLCALRLVRCKLPLRHWNLRNLTLQQECYLTTGMLPYKHSSRALEIFTAYTVLSHGSLAISQLPGKAVSPSLIVHDIAGRKLRSTTQYDKRASTTQRELTPGERVFVKPIPQN